jgi:hypothetical protein
MTADILREVVLFVAGLFGLWTAVACRRAHQDGYPGADAMVWGSLSAVFFLLCLIKTARSFGLLQGFGGILRDLFKQRGWYEDRRVLQITATVTITMMVFVLLAWGVRWSWDFLKRYRLAVGFAGLTVGFAAIRFISLHEVDAWIAEMAWLRASIDLLAAGGVSAVAIARLRQIREITALNQRKLGST